MEKIHQAIKYYRKRNNLTQKQLAEKIHIDPNSISHFESGRRTPTLDVLRSLSRALQVTPKMLLEPNENIWGEDYSFCISQEFSHLETNPYFFKKTEDERSINYIFYSSLEFKGLGRCAIKISKKLLFCYDFVTVNYEKRDSTFLELFFAPDWFKNLFANSLENFLKLQQSKNKEIAIYNLSVCAAMKVYEQNPFPKNTLDAIYQKTNNFYLLSFPNNEFQSEFNLLTERIGFKPPLQTILFANPS